MPSGVYRLRNSRKTQPNVRVGHEQKDLSGLRGTATRDKTANVDCGSGLAPTKPGTFEKWNDRFYTRPKPMDRPVSGREGKVRGRQSDKSSKGK